MFSAKLNWSPEMTSQSFPVSCFWSWGFVPHRKWNLMLLVHQTTGKENRYWNIFLLFLSVYCSDFIEQIKKLVIYTLSVHLCHATYCVQEINSKLTLLPAIYRAFLSLFFGPKFKHTFEHSLKILLHIPKWFNTFQVLKWFSFLLRVTCIIFCMCD